MRDVRNGIRRLSGGSVQVLEHRLAQLVHRSKRHLQLGLDVCGLRVSAAGRLSRAIEHQLRLADVQRANSHPPSRRSPSQQRTGATGLEPATFGFGDLSRSPDW